MSGSYTLYGASVLLGLLGLFWSAEKFVAGSASLAHYYRVPPLLIGMLVIGFGTSVPEMTVSIISALGGNYGISLGNAYGSNITNIALILGLTALMKPLVIDSGILRKELAWLIFISLVTVLLIYDGKISRLDSVLLLGLFAIFLYFSIVSGKSKQVDSIGVDVLKELKDDVISVKKTIVIITASLILLILSSRVVVWGSVELAKLLGMSQLIIGLTIVAIGTSLPELASSIAATRKGEYDLSLGNIIGSNIFNTLAVVGMSGLASPMTVTGDIIRRDVPVMILVTVGVLITGIGFKKQGRINRLEGLLFVSAFILYNYYLFFS